MSLNLSQIIETVKADLSKNYDPLIFNIRILNNILSGEVILKKQKDLFIEKLNENNILFEDKIIVLSDYSTPPQYGFGKSAKDIVNVYKKPILHPDKLSPRGFSLLRSTQITPADFSFRVLYKENNWFLIQLIDKTLGWIKEDEFIEATEEKKPDVITYKEETFRETINSYLGIKYRIGGTTKLGIDCSGLMQRIFMESMNLLLPKFSKAQKKKGISIKKAEIMNADLVFGTSKEKGTSHVGIFFDNKITHACLREKKVIQESFEEFEDYYHITDYRRMI